MGRKIEILLQIVLILLMTTACGNNGQGEAQNTQTYIGIEDTQSPVYEASDAEPPVSYEVSDVEAVVCYEGEDFRKSVFATGGDMLYIYGIKPEGSYFFGGMEEEEAQFQEFAVEMADDMRIAYMTVDNTGSCHMLWISVETTVVNGATQNRRTYERAYITVMDKSGELKAKIDVSELFGTGEIRPNYFCFAVDNRGNYYIEAGREIIKLRADGSVDTHIPCAGAVQAVGCGKSGEIYCIYTGEGGEEIIGRVEQNSGAAQNSEAAQVVSCEATLPSADALYLYLASGTDTELLFYNKAGGAYTYNAETGTVEQRIWGEDLPVSGMNVSGYGFLGDGRLCLLITENEKQVFYYVPCGNINPTGNIGSTGNM